LLDKNTPSLLPEFGRPTRLRMLAHLVWHQPSSRALDARIALETGWLQSYMDIRDDGYMVTGVITGDYFERYPLYAPWFRHAPLNWWDDGTVICNRVPNLPRYTSDVGTSLLTIPCIAAAQPCRIIVHHNEQWTVKIYDSTNEKLLGNCEPGTPSLAKTFVLAGIDYRIRQFEEVSVLSFKNE
jgi:hypothetical protein